MKLKIVILGIIITSSNHVLAVECPLSGRGAFCLTGTGSTSIVANTDNVGPDVGFRVYIGPDDPDQILSLHTTRGSTTIDTESTSKLIVNENGTNITTATGKVTQFGDTDINFNGQTLTGINAGAISSTSTDAINGSQLYTEQQERIAADTAATTDRALIRQEFASGDEQTLISANSYTDTEVTIERNARIAADNAATADRALIRQELAEGDARTLASAKHYTDQRLNKLDERMQAAVAASIAIATLPQPTEAGASMISVGLGNWESEQGYAVGISGVTENNKWIYKAAGTANSIGKFGAGISLGFQWK